MSAPSRLETIKNYTNLYSTRIPKAVGFIAYAVSGVIVAKKCTLIAHGCISEGSRLVVNALKEKSLESANKYVLQAGLTFSVCQPSYGEFAALSIAAAACATLAYSYARDFLKPLPPSTPSPHRKV